MCRLLAVRSQHAFSPAPFLEKFAFIAKHSKEFQGHGWGCAWVDPTGLWQIYGRGLSEWDDRSRLDIAYVQRRCLWLDIQILFRTVPAVLAQRGAK